MYFQLYKKSFWKCTGIQAFDRHVKMRSLLNSSCSAELLWWAACLSSSDCGVQWYLKHSCTSSHKKKRDQETWSFLHCSENTHSVKTTRQIKTFIFFVKALSADSGLRSRCASVRYLACFLLLFRTESICLPGTSSGAGQRGSRRRICCNVPKGPASWCWSWEMGTSSC